MAALSNDSARCEILNLGWGHAGHGPYLVRQVGYVPGGASLREEPFILLRDGRWLLNLAYAALSDAEQEAQLFHDLADLSRFLDSQQGTPVRADAALPPDKDPAELMRDFETCTRRILRGMRNCLQSKAGQ